jgi:hypothetical protein
MIVHKLNIFCNGIFLKTEDGEGGHLTCKLILYSGTYDSLNLNTAQKICLPFVIRITASMEYILSGDSPLPFVIQNSCPHSSYTLSHVHIRRTH